MTRSRPRRTLLRTRVLAGVLSITLVALAGFDVAAGSVLRRYLVGQTDSALQRGLSLARPQLPLLLARIESGRPPMPVRLLRILGEYYLAFVSDSGSTVILESDPSLAPRLPADLPVIAADHSAQTVTARDGHGELRLRAMPAYGGTLVVTAYLDVVNRTVTRLRLIVTVGSAAAGLLIALGVVLVLRRGLRPLETMAIQADRITAGDLTERVSLADGGSEVGRLGVALNGMLARIEAAVTERKASEELTQRFFADASHELRTPLAALRATAELYQQGALLQRAQVDEAMRRIGVEARRMSRLVDDMLRLARLDQRPAQQSDPVDLTALAEGCAERARSADPRRTWPAHIAAGLVAVGDEELLRRAIDNLLANVRAHTPAGTVATMTVAGRGSSVIVEVSDNGPGVPADRLPRIFDRFYRAGSQGHEPGSGLGLAIVAEIATAHKGTAQATLNDPHGLRVTLTLPAGSEGHRAGQEPPPVQAK